MARPYSDDLRRKILRAYGTGEVTLEQLAQRFDVSYGYVKKIRRQQLRHHQMERVVHHPGRKPKLIEPIRERLRGWLRQQPDLTLAELQEKLLEQAQLRVSQPSLWVVLRKKMGLRLKKSRSTPKNKTARGSSSSARPGSRKSARSKTGNGSSSTKPGSTRS
jgi:transposase